MSLEHPLPNGRSVSTGRAVRHHLVLVTLGVMLGAVGGVLYAASVPASYISTARVLVNPSVGNPFVPTPMAVRQDELTSLETEAQVARSTEVLGPVAAAQSPVMTTTALERGLQVTVPPNTQILAISYSAADPKTAQRITGSVARVYLDNRARRFDEVTAERIDQVQTQIDGVVADLRDATAAALTGSTAVRSFQAQLATALRNDLVSLRAQRTALQTSETPAGSIISPATTPESARNLMALVPPVGGAAAGLAVAILLAILLERSRGVLRSASEVEEAGLAVVAAVPAGGRPAAMLHRGAPQDFDGTVRRLRAAILDLDPRPDTITIAPAGSGDSDAEISEAVAESFARAGHRVVLVRTDAHPNGGGLTVEEGLAQALLYERLNVLELLLPSVEPLLCVLPGGFTPQSREFLSAERMRAVLSPLVEAGNLVVIQSPGLDTVEGEAMMGAADLGVVVVTVGRTRRSAVESVTQRMRSTWAPSAALVVRHRAAAHRQRLSAAGTAPERSEAAVPAARTRHLLSRAHR